MSTSDRRSMASFVPGRIVRTTRREEARTMFARAAVLIALLPALAVSDVPPPLDPGWLPETAVIEIPGEAPITVTFLAELQKPDPVYADYESALEAARAGDGEAAYLLFKQAMRCDLMRLRKERAE